jgi:dCTP deaminase
MSFWSSQTLEARLGTLIEPPNLAAIDCNAITLHMGPEFYTTPSPELPAPSSHTKTLLAHGQPFAIPPGQFAFLQTEEAVTVPEGAMAFISMKAKTKFRGLVNVSGFHVDPGWHGPLIFAVFNAGPSTVHLQRGMPLFLIWYADLDGASALRKTKPGPTSIPPDLINNITGELNSFSSLEKRITDESKKLSDRIHAIEKSQIRIQVSAAVVISILVAVIGYALRGVVDEWWKAHSASTQPVPVTQPLQPPSAQPTPTSSAGKPSVPTLGNKP